MKLEFAVAAVRRATAAARLVGPLILFSACSDGPYLMTEQYMTREGQAEEYIGGGCIGVQDGGGMGSGTAGAAGQAALQPSFSLSYEGTGDSIHFVVSDGAGMLVVERNYDSDYLSSGQREEINAPVTRGSLRFVHWGSKKCEDIRAPDGS
ncbi:MAG TPA: hypothetical protein VGK73_25120 [Polyangiaceae bacterium]